MDRVIYSQKLTDVSLTRKDPLGALRCENGIMYKYVRLQNDTATVAGVAGDPCSYAATLAGASVDGYGTGQVVLDNTDAQVGGSQAICAGFLINTVAGVLDTAYYVWIQLTGSIVVPTAVGSGVVGSNVMMTQGGSGDKTLVIATGVLGTCGILLTTSGANNKVLARCPF